MRASEFIVEYKKYPTTEYGGVTFTMVEKDGQLIVKALNDFGIAMGYVIFNMDGKELDPKDLEVEEKYQGQGIASTMYDYIKSQGFTINRSFDQTDAGRGFWDKHRGEDSYVWEDRGQGAAGIVLYAEDTGRYGLQQRSNEINDPGLWAAWGGGREPGESLEQCARRELAEESGYTGPIKLQRLGENSKYVTFLGTVPHEFEPRANDEWQDYCWVSAGDWPAPMHPGVAAALRNISVKQNVAEAFDQPYPMTWEHGDESHDALVKLPDGSNLSIMFSMDYGAYGDEEWTVEFWRNNSQEVTGEGDQQRIFATVLSAIQQFIKTEHPERIRFSANKDVEPGQKSQTRSNLYTKLVQRYANSWGYGVDVDDFADTTVYNLHTLNESVAEGLEQISIKVRKGHNKFATELSVDGKTAGVYQYDANSGRSIAEVYPEYKGKGFGKILVLHAIYTAAKLGMDFVEDESRTAEYDNVLDSLDSNGLAVNDDGYWYVTGQGEQFLKQSLKQGVAENFADGKVKGKSRPGRVKRAGASCKGSVSDLRARAKRYGGERGKMYHWCANMKSGRSKTNEERIAQAKIGPFDVGIDDHVYEREQHRKVSMSVTDNILRKLKFPRVVNKIRELTVGQKFWLFDSRANVALGIRKTGDDTLYFKTVWNAERGRPTTHNAVLITI